jgi:CRISPR-associated protein Csb2
MQYLLITVSWLDERYHGLLGREGPPEWPPSPFRLFQALVAGVARRNELDGDVGKALEFWLERRSREQSPLICAPRVCAGQIVTRFVPNNDGDKKPDRQDRLTAKTSRPTVMLDSPRVHYLWPVTEEDIGKALQVCQAAKYLSILGWGVDMAYADAQLIDESEINKLPGVRWRPKPDAVRDVGMLRIPKAGSLKDLNCAHQ